MFSILKLWISSFVAAWGGNKTREREKSLTDADIACTELTLNYFLGGQKLKILSKFICNISQIINKCWCLACVDTLDFLEPNI